MGKTSQRPHLKPVAPLVATLLLLAAAHASATVTVEFSEANLTSLTLLDGTTHFSPQGLSFGNTTYYAIDAKFIGAGVDDRGITTTFGPDNLMSVIFDAGATSANFDWVAIGSASLFATAYDAGGGVLDSQTATGLGTYYGTFTFGGIGTIHEVVFHDDNGEVGVGRVSFEPVPEPSAGCLLAAGLVGWAGCRNGRRRRES